MKMNRSYLIILAVGFALFSCAKPDMQDGVDSNRGVMDNSMDYITAAGPGAPVKTVVNNGTKVFWTDSDQIGLYAGEGTANYSTALDEPSATALFGRVSDVVPEKSNGKYYAIYPLSAISKWNLGTDGAGSDNTFCLVNVPQTQVAVKGSWDKSSAILVATSETNELAFKHAVAYLRFEISEQVKDLVSVRLSSVNREPLSDTQAGLKFNTSGKLEIVPGDEPFASIELTNSDADAAFESGAYYISLLPGEFAEGLTLTFTDAQDKVAEIAIDPLTLEAGQVADKGLLESLNFVKVQPPLKKATVYTDDNGVNQGVVFWVNPDKPSEGKIISGATTFVKWGPAKDLSDAMDEYLTGDHTIAEKAEFVKAASDYSEANYSAVYFCDNLGEGWRLPHRDELVEMLKVYWGQASLTENTKYNIDDNSSSMDKFDEALAQCVTDDPATSYNETKLNYGTPTSNVNYWTGHANPASLPSTRIFRVNMAPTYVYASYANPTNVQYVRCVREVGTTQDMQ